MTLNHLNPALMGFRLQAGDYLPMPAVSGRLPSEVLGLHFEAHDEDLSSLRPGRRLPTPAETREFGAEHDQTKRPKLNSLLRPGFARFQQLC
jgi:hypothetical protein